LHRIGRLEGIPDAAITDVAEHFKQRIAQHSDQPSETLGRSTLDAILAAMSAQSRPLAAADSRTTPRRAEPPPARDFPSSDAHRQELAHKIRLAEHTLPETNEASLDDRQSGYETSRPEPTHGAEPTLSSEASPPTSTDAIATHLESLPPAELCQALGKVDTRVAMLALCGLPGHTTNAALAVLPKAEAKRVRQAMNSIGSLNLRDIDDAKEAVARASVTSRQHAPLAA
jgi:flagellar motor switch protein FliG